MEGRRETESDGARTKDMGEGTTGDGPREPEVGRVRSELIGGTAAGVFLLVGGWLVLGGEPQRAAAAVILWSAALAVAGLGFGRPMARGPGPAAGTDGDGGAGSPDGPGRSDEETPEGAVASARRALNLSERVALGPLGGLLGGAVVAAVAWAVGAIGLADLLSVDVGAAGGLPGFGRRLWTGAIWGLLLGIFYPRMPGRSPVGRGVLFSFIPATWSLLVEYPFLRAQGWAGVELGELTFVLVLLLHVVWGATVGTVFQWAELTSEEDLDRPLGAAA